MDDVLGQALLDYQTGNYSEDITTFSSLDEEDVMPLPYLFRGYKDMPPLEREALKLCRGSILDIGCGAGSHSLLLQEKGYEVT
ncbi:MAG: SAM-dependent methyltransferase, partial [Pricia sp.]